jgi:RNA recognition motif-containing protein
MGNIEKWMSHSYLSNLLKSINIYPKRITIKNYKSKRGCAFLEFLSHEKAEEILNSFNGKKINNLELRFNWLKTLEEKLSIPQIKKFTVNN